MRESVQIKKRLQGAFPNEKFYVRIGYVGGDKRIEVYTSMIKAWTDREYVLYWEWEETKRKGGAISDEIVEFLRKIEKNKENERKIREVLKDCEKVYYCEWSGEVLAGGNTYLFIGPIERYERVFKKQKREGGGL